MDGLSVLEVASPVTVNRPPPPHASSASTGVYAEAVREAE